MCCCFVTREAKLPRVCSAFPQIPEEGVQPSQSSHSAILAQRPSRKQLLVYLEHCILARFSGILLDSFSGHSQGCRSFECGTRCFVVVAFSHQGPWIMSRLSASAPYFFLLHFPHCVFFAVFALMRLFSVVGPAPGAAPGEAPCSVLDVEIDNLDKRLGLCLGGTEEVAVFNRFMFGA